MRSTKSFRSKRKAITAEEETSIRIHRWPTITDSQNHHPPTIQGIQGELLLLASSPQPFPWKDTVTTLLKEKKYSGLNHTNGPQQIVAIINIYMKSTSMNMTFLDRHGNSASYHYTMIEKLKSDMLEVLSKVTQLGSGKVRISTRFLWWSPVRLSLHCADS